MSKHPFPSESCIIDHLTTVGGITDMALTPIPWGADIDDSIYKAQASDQSCYFVKVRRGHVPDIGTQIQSLLHDAGIQQSIFPITTRDRQPSCHIDDCTLIVYPFIENTDGFRRDLTRDQCITLGKNLRQIHELKLPTHIQNRIPRESYSSEWQKAVRSIYTQIDD